jgi:GTPase SAR1 family protein
LKKNHSQKKKKKKKKYCDDVRRGGMGARQSRATRSTTSLLVLGPAGSGKTTLLWTARRAAMDSGTGLDEDDAAGLQGGPPPAALALGVDEIAWTRRDAASGDVVRIQVWDVPGDAGPEQRELWRHFDAAAQLVLYVVDAAALRDDPHGSRAAARNVLQSVLATGRRAERIFVFVNNNKKPCPEDESLARETVDVFVASCVAASRDALTPASAAPATLNARIGDATNRAQIADLFDELAAFAQID